MRKYQILFRWLNNKKETAIVKRVRNKLKRQGADYKISEAYVSDYQENRDFSGCTTDVKTIAFYLPQFHTFPENDQWWGMGFTEWTNTRKCVPRFEGHYQPRIPHKDIGYYDLSTESAIEKQIQLALQHKVYGFCFYYYWFSGKKLMEKPLDIFLKHPEWKINFCLCWANENFTRTWDGAATDILIEQKYTNEDPKKFIMDLKKYISDERYIRIDGKPVILIYNMSAIPDVKKTICAWRNYAQKEGIGDILIWMCRTNGSNAKVLGVKKEIDAEVEFPPHNMWWKPIKENWERKDEAKIYNYQKLVDVLTYRIEKEKNKRQGKKLYHTCMMGWDNSCRRKNGWTVYYGYKLEYFGKWLSVLVDEARKNKEEEERFIFVNAWNEWGEGTYLEPDEKYGYANINMLSEQICVKRQWANGKEEE